MIFLYEDLKKQITLQDVLGTGLLNSILNYLEKLYEADEFGLIYVRNLYNDREPEIIIFLEKGYLIINIDHDKGTFSFEEHRCYLISKRLTASRYKYKPHELKLIFENGNELTLHNINDSNNNWAEEYTDSLLKIYSSL